MQLEVTREAARRIRLHGGALYIWQEAVGEVWSKDESAFTQPDGYDFRRHFDAGVYVFLADGLSPSHIRVKPQAWPWRGVKVFFEGRRWGQRGRVSGETGLSYDGAGPP